MPKPNSEVGKRLRQYGEKHYPSMKAFAEALNIHPVTLNNYLNGNSGLGPKIRHKLIKHGCDVNWLLYGDESNKIEKEQQEITSRLQQVEVLLLAQANELEKQKQIVNSLKQLVDYIVKEKK